MRYFLIVFLFSATTSIAQTYIMPIIGIDALRLNRVPFNYEVCLEMDNHGCIQEGFVINRPFLGIKLEQSIRKQLMLYYQISYTEKNYDNSYGLHGFEYSLYGEEINFNYFFQDLGLTWNFIDNLCADIGIHFTRYTNIEFSYIIVPNNSNENPPLVNIENKKQLGSTVGISYTLNNINMRLAVHKSFLNNSKNNDWGGVKLSPPTSISLSVGYRFHLFDKINLRKGQGCPTF